ncbi:multiheme c-type cytochrome [Curvibacter sp. APW13]|uniref:cytochrome c3 family protein n=1 Tax=Curvibacter sp. APW13 TaxID=3077236 RepID=UPI0028DEB66A|nr:cytochrome c3 family protein [Curvibacter sp. APW13]MDT8989845.1 multiheme c-type cytochrome [Curvibacter sp. APW13]
MFMLLALAAAAALLWWWLGARTATAPAQDAALPARFVGAAQCASCHAAQHQAWSGSQHAHSMQSARRDTVLAPFVGEQLRHGKVTSRFSREGDRFFVQTDGADGRLQRFEVLHTFGIYPLQQYLVALDGGQVQALATAWDSRPQAQGGQRWFHLQGPHGVAAGDELHWTQRQSNWNTMCAECHSTDFQKRYDPASKTFSSTFAEMNVACEACHGPGSRHVEWAQSGQRDAAAKGFAVDFSTRAAVSWPIDPATGVARPSSIPSGPTEARTEVQVCARCHAHRSQEWPDHAAGQSLADTHRISRIEPGLFESDGQMRAEVFNLASFLQSKMFAKGVTCSHCHEPHSGQLRAPGNAVCAQCHDTQRFDTPAHHHHTQDSAGAQCTNCHMPTTTYMQVDPRHDHSLRVPRPDRSVARGTPNACSNCHRKEGTAWVAAAAQRWYPQLGQRPTPLADALYAQETGRAEARTLLAAVVADRSQSAMARASALARLNGPWNRDEWSLVRSAAQDAEGLVRAAAVELLQQAPAPQRMEVLLPLLDDPLRTLRMAAGRALADVPAAQLAPQAAHLREAALADYVRGQQSNADRPEALNNLALLSATQGDLQTARIALEQALAAAPDFVATRLNLADVLRAQGQEAQALQVLEAAVRAQPASGAVWYALGLARHRAGQQAQALQALQQASRRAPQEAAYAYALALAQDAAGQGPAAIATLQDSLRRHGEQRATLEALVQLGPRAGLPRPAQDSYRMRLRAIER